MGHGTDGAYNMIILNITLWLTRPQWGMRYLEGFGSVRAIRTLYLGLFSVEIATFHKIDGIGDTIRDEMK